MSAVLTAYEPRPGSLADRAISHLQGLPRGTELTTATLAAAIQATPLNVRTSLEFAKARGALFCRQKGGHARSPLFWSLVDHGSEPGWAPVMDAASQHMKRAVDRIAELPAPDSQHVVKAEPARADATDRETPAIASPRGGAKGSGQPAAAGPAGELRIALWSDGQLQIQRNGGDLVVFSRDETRQLVAYLDAIAVDRGEA